MAHFRIKTIQANPYRGCQIWIRYFAGSIVEYLTLIEGQPYAAHIGIELPFWRRVWHFFTGEGLTETELKAATVQACKMAEATIDTVLANKK